MKFLKKWWQDHQDHSISELIVTYKRSAGAESFYTSPPGQYLALWDRDAWLRFFNVLGNTKPDDLQVLNTASLP